MFKAQVPLIEAVSFNRGNAQLLALDRAGTGSEAGKGEEGRAAELRDKGLKSTKQSPAWQANHSQRLYSPLRPGHAKSALPWPALFLTASPDEGQTRAAAELCVHVRR